ESRGVRGEAWQTEQAASDRRNSQSSTVHSSLPRGNDAEDDTLPVSSQFERQCQATTQARIIWRFHKSPTGNVALRTCSKHGLHWRAHENPPSRHAPGLARRPTANSSDAARVLRTRSRRAVDGPPRLAAGAPRGCRGLFRSSVSGAIPAIASSVVSARNP